MQMTPTIAFHMSAAIGALAIGPFALWARLGRKQRPVLHRTLGYSWVALMVATAVSALFIRDFKLPNLVGYTPVHLLIPATIGGLALAFWRLAKRDIAGHRRSMQITYVSGCVVAGAFTLLPNRYLGTLLWSAFA